MSLKGKALLERARDVDLLILDVDGVLTDGGLYYGPDGEVMKRFNVKDGHGLVLARLTGLRAAILTARRSGLVKVRFEDELKLSPVSQGNRDKRAGLFKLLEEAGVPPHRAGYVGDDVNDLAPMQEVRFTACPSDACSEVRRTVHYVAGAPGGHGAVREIVELLLKAQGKWKQALDIMLNGVPDLATAGARPAAAGDRLPLRKPKRTR